MNNPPNAVKMVCAIVNTIFGEKIDQKDSWKKTQKFMSNPKQAIEMMKSFDFNRVNEKLLKNVKSHIQTVGNDEIQPE